MNPALKNARAKAFTKLWVKLNRPQKVLMAMLSFIGQTDNGGVWQFLFNEPQLAIAALEAMQELGETRLARDYQAVLGEVLGKGQTISALRKKAIESKLSTGKGWRAFAKGYEQLTSARTIEKYFYTTSYKKKLHKRVADHVESHFPFHAEINEIS
jgi:hypothetical protein